MNAIVTLTIGDSPLWEYTLPSMHTACARHGWGLEMIEARTVNVTRCQNPVTNISFEKFQAIDYLDEYDRIMIFDADAMLSPTCPDIFAAVPEDAIGGVMEDVGSRFDNRREWIATIKLMAMDARLDGWNEGYMNSGVMVLSACHREAMTLNLDDVRVRDVSLPDGFNDQNVVNYLAQRSGFPICALGYKWNHMSIFSEEWNGSPDPLDSHIIHYAGLKPEARLERAERDFAAWYKRDVA